MLCNIFHLLNDYLNFNVIICGLTEKDVNGKMCFTICDMCVCNVVSRDMFVCACECYVESHLSLGQGQRKL